MDNRKHSLFAVVLCLMFFSSGLVKAQEINQRFIINNDTVYTGHYYFLETKEHDFYTCRLISVTKESILIFCEDETKKISIENIAGLKSRFNPEWENGVSPSGKTILFYAGAGLSFPFNVKGYESDLFRPGISVNAGVNIVIGNYVGFRVEFDYWRAGRKDDISGSYTETGGQIDAFSIKAGLTGGEFHSKNVNYHFMLLAGTGLAYRKARHVTETNNNIQYDFGGGQDLIFLVGLGADVNVKISKKLKIFFEPQVNFITSVDMSLPDYFAVRSGIIF